MSDSHGDDNAGPDDLRRRAGLPDNLCGLLRRHPRDGWPERTALGDWTRFWLERHDIFRALDAALRDGCRQCLDGAVDAERFRQWALPRLNMQIGHLDLHHQVEEFHIFPAFATVEPSLNRGYALLEADHEVIHPLPAEARCSRRCARPPRCRRRRGARRDGDSPCCARRALATACPPSCRRGGPAAAGRADAWRGGATAALRARSLGLAPQHPP